LIPPSGPGASWGLAAAFFFLVSLFSPSTHCDLGAVLSYDGLVVQKW
jgi:hypothetical protein